MITKRRAFFIRILMLFVLGGLQGCKSAEDLLLEATAADAEGNAERAYTCYLAAAEKGNVDAENQVGERLEKGRGTPRDIEAAMAWYKKAADAQNVTAMGNLGALRLAWNLTGHSPPPDEGRPWLTQGVTYLQRAAEQENPRACGLLAFLMSGGYYELRGDSFEAARLADKAQSKGDLYALLRKAWFAQPGARGPLDDIGTEKIFLAASIGNSEGLRDLAGFYQNGIAVGKDLVHAHRLLHMASDRRNAAADQALKTLESQMTPEELAEARRLGPTDALLPSNQAAAIASPTYTGHLPDIAPPPPSATVTPSPEPPAYVPESATPVVRILIPAAGEIWTRGQPQQVPLVYEAYCSSGYFTIELIRGGQVARVLLRASHKPAWGNPCKPPSEHTTYRTTLFPPIQSDAPGSDYKLRFTTQEGVMAGESDYFTIQ